MRAAGQGPTVDYSWDASLVTTAGVRWRIEVAGATPVTGTLGKSVATGPLAITESRRRSRHDQPERRRRRGQRHDHLHDERRRDRHRNAPRRERAPSSRRSARRCALAAGRAHARVRRSRPARRRLHDRAHGDRRDGHRRHEPGDRLRSPEPSSGLRSRPAVLTPNGDGIADALTVTFQLAAPASVRLRMLRDGKWVATPYTGALPAGPQSLAWNGARTSGKTPDGSYEAVLEATDAVGTAVVSLPFLLDAHRSGDQARRRATAPLGLRGRDADRPGQRLPAAPDRPRAPGIWRSPGSARSGRSSSPHATTRGTGPSSGGPDEGLARASASRLAACNPL